MDIGADLTLSWVAIGVGAGIAIGVLVLTLATMPTSLPPVTVPTRCVLVDSGDRRVTIRTAECSADWLLDIDGQRKLFDDWTGR